MTVNRCVQLLPASCQRRILISLARSPRRLKSFRFPNYKLARFGDFAKKLKRKSKSPDRKDLGQSHGSFPLGRRRFRSLSGAVIKAVCLYMFNIQRISRPKVVMAAAANGNLAEMYIGVGRYARSASTCLALQQRRIAGHYKVYSPLLLKTHPETAMFAPLTPRELLFASSQTPL